MTMEKELKAGREVEACELINNFLQHSTAFEHLSPRRRFYLCVFEVRGVREDWG